MANNQYFFNFPVTFLDGFLLNHQHVLLNIICFVCYEESLDLEFGDDLEKFKDKATYHGFRTDEIETWFKMGKKLYDDIKGHPLPKTGITRGNIIKFHDGDNSEFDRVCLLAHLALKSILHTKPYVRVDKFYLYSRMDGLVKSVTARHKDHYSCMNEPMSFPDPVILEGLTIQIRKYATHRKWDNIRNTLEDKWHWIIPKKLPRINDKGKMELKQIRGSNYFTQLKEREFYTKIIESEKKKFAKKQNKNQLLFSLVEEFNSKTVE